MASFETIAKQSFDNFYNLPSSRIYWDGKKSIFAKIDWLTLVYNNASVKDVLSCLDLDGFFDASDVAQSLEQRSVNFLSFSTYISITICNVSFFINLLEARYKFYDLVDSGLPSVDEFLSTEWDDLRVDITGSGLDYLRSLGVNVDSSDWRSDTKLSGVDRLGKQLQYHATRIDVAFDLLDFSSGLFGSFSDCVRMYLDTLGRVPVGLQQRKKFVVAEVREGATRSIYMGRGTSDKLLRIYDKNFQLKNNPDKIPYQDNDGKRPITWIRFELQARREIECAKLLFSIDWTGVWHYIYSNFAVLRPNGLGGREVVPCWSDLFESVETQTIIQNANFAKFYIPSTEDKAYKQVIRNIRSLTEFSAFFGHKNLTGLIDKYLSNLQSTCEVEDLKKWARILSELKYSSSGEQPGYFWYDPIQREYKIIDNGEADNKFFDLFNSEGNEENEGI